MENVFARKCKTVALSNRLVTRLVDFVSNQKRPNKIYTFDFRPGFIYDTSATLRNVCQDVCETDYCRAGQKCVQTGKGAVCVDEKPEPNLKRHSKFTRDSITDDEGM